MYYNFIYVSIILGLVLIPFLVPIHLKSPVLRHIRNFLCCLLLISCIIASTPQQAVEGAPLHKFGQLQVAFLGCNYQIIKTATFCSRDPPFFGTDCYCYNPNAMATIAHCYNVSHKTEVGSFLDMCSTSYNITITRSQFDEALSNYSKYAKSVSEIEHFNKSVPVDFPVKLEDTVIRTYKNAYNQFLGNYDRSVDYGTYLVLYWCVVFGLAAIGNWTKLMFPGVYKSATGPVSNWFRSSISLPALKGKYKTNEKPFMKVLDMLVPTRAETLILAGFLALTLFLVHHNIQFFEGDPIFRSKSEALLRYFAVRTSILTSAVFPLLILFGGRNNFLQWVTRWDYSTFIAFHRWLSRLIMILITIHAVCYSLMMRPFTKKVRQAYIIWGALAIWAGGAIMVQGLLVLRRKHYESFLVIHIVLALMFVVGAWVHVLNLYCLWFYYYAAGIWFFDRIIRIARLYAFGFPKARVVLLADESLKIIVPKPPHWDVVPGGHAFIHFLWPSCFWQSHPFTYTVSVDPNESNIILFIKVKHGVTERLYNFLKHHPHRSTEIRVAIEGSYGESTPATKYDSAVFVAGGNGIPGIYAEVYDMNKRSPLNQQQLHLIWIVREFKSLYWFYEELLSLKNTRIHTTIYVTRPELASCIDEFDKRFPVLIEDHPASISDEEDTNDDAQLGKPLLGSGTQLQDYNSISSSEMQDYNTIHGSSSEQTNNILSVESVTKTIQSELSHIEFKFGRPSMDLLVSQTVKNSPGSSAFVTCGHPVMVDDLRAAVVHNIYNDEKKRVDYYEQLQVWA